MFTGIIESTATILSTDKDQKNLHIWLESTIAKELKIDQSVSHNGICLTVDELESSKNAYRITAIDETIQKTNICNWKTGDQINIERAMVMNGRLDGHIVQGHVDGTGECTDVFPREGSTEFTFRISPEKGALIIEKGSICINGVSLTIYDVQRDTFKVSIIPYTMQHTNFSTIERGSKVNIEFDVVGKYIHRMQTL